MVHHPILVLWSRLVSFACATILLLAVVHILAQIDGWVKFDTGPEILREIGARLILSLGVGALFGTAVTLLTIPFIGTNEEMIRARCERIARLASSVVAVGFAAAIVGILVRWSTRTALVDITNRAAIVLWLSVSAVLIAAYALYPRVAGRDARVDHDFVNTFSGPVTRRFLLIGALAGLMTAFSGTAAPRPARPSRKSASRPSPPNVILVTFDALCAEDMSCYGYHLATTPNIDALARNSYRFTNYYATSTFTTPAVTSMLTGRYPSNTRIYHYGGRLHGVDAERTLPRELRKAGYRTTASVANPGAHPDCLGFGGDFDDLPVSPIEDVATRESAAAFHSAVLAEDARVAAQLIPYTLEQISPRLFGQRRTRVPPSLSFQQAEALLATSGEPQFLWVHTFAPHFPYLPDPPYLHRFLADDELRTHAEFANMVDLKGYWYSRSRQPIVNKARLRYDEWVAQADGAFGAFMTRLRALGHLENTVLIVSADHGESFAGGFVGHGGGTQQRPILHVPLLIHLPGQTQGRALIDTCDQTALAPTILDLVGLRPPEWMDGESLCPRLRDQTRATSGEPPLAYTQYLEPNSIFEPVRRGTVGVIDGSNQYVLSLERKTGALFDLAEADRQERDRSASEPALAARLHGEIERKFPRLFGGTL